MNTLPRLAVVIPTRNPHPERWRAVLNGLASQSLAPSAWELCVVDNGSTTPVVVDTLPVTIPRRVVSESRAGLLWARLAGMRQTHAPFILFMDDDTVPTPGTLAAAIDFLESHPDVGTAGARIRPHYLVEPPPWIDEVEWALALRDFGPKPLVWSTRVSGSLPPWSPIGAGLLVQRAALPVYYAHVASQSAEIEKRSWRGQGGGGNEDKDLVLCLLRAGWATAYCPGMEFTHLIPAERLTLAYFERLIPALGTMWMQTLQAHGFPAFPTVTRLSLPLRYAKAWWVLRAWRGTRERLRWLNTRGHLAGLAANHRDPFRYLDRL